VANQGRGGGGDRPPPEKGGISGGARTVKESQAQSGGRQTKCKIVETCRGGGEQIGVKVRGLDADHQWQRGNREQGGVAGFLKAKGWVIAWTQEKRTFRERK